MQLETVEGPHDDSSSPAIICVRCGKNLTLSLGTTERGEWFKCESCGHVFMMMRDSMSKAH